MPLAKLLRQRGAEAIVAPLISIRYVNADAGSALRHRPRWIVFTSLHGVRGFHRAMDRAGLDARALAGASIAAVGPKTAAMLRPMGLRADVVAPEHRAISLVQTLSVRLEGGDRVLFPCGSLAREETAAGLRAAGANVHELVVYETRSAALSSAALRQIERGVDVVLLHSPSAAKSAMRQRLPISNALIACIGPTTAHAAREFGMQPAVVPAVYSDEGLLNSLELHIRATQEEPV
jgi:uroporphyrinogen III methyltransferase/synthase